MPLIVLAFIPIAFILGVAVGYELSRRDRIRQINAVLDFFMSDESEGE